MLTLNDLRSSAGVLSTELAKTPKLLGYLKQYFREGYYPTFLEMGSYMSYSQSLRGIVDKIMYQDVSSFYSLNTTSLDTLKRLSIFLLLRSQGVSILIVWQGV